MTCKSRVAKFAGCLVLGVLLLGVTAYAAVEKYKVHDTSRPRPPVIQSQAYGQPPSDAIVLFNGKDLSQWRSDKGGTEAKWTIIDDEYMVVPPKAAGIHTAQKFGNCQLHVEWKTPEGVPPEVRDQKRSNSGVFLMDRYEVQVLDSYTDDDYKTNYTYADGQASAVYGSHPPMVNASRKPGEWQTYDIAFLKPLFDESGKCVRKARITVFHNGVCVHNNLEIEGTTSHKIKAAYGKPHTEGSIRLQDHGNPLAFRNIWIRPLPEQPYLIE